MTLSTLSPAKRPHRVTLQRPGPPVSDGEGGFDQSWIDLKPPTLFASIIPATPSNMEDLAPAGAVQVQASYLINVPFHPGITTATRVSYNGRTFFVAGIQNPEERDVELWLAVEERLPTTEDANG